MPLTTIDGLILGTGLISVWLWTRSKSAGPFPPGPKGLPLIGNAAEMPKEREWITFAEWGRKWGGIMSVSVLGQLIIIVNSASVMEEMDKKGATLSDRPILPMGGELVGYNETLVLQRGAKWRNYRRHCARFLGSTKAISLLHPTIDTECRKFLQRVTKKPDMLLENLRKLAGAIILHSTYGYDVAEEHDHFVELIEKANSNFNAATSPGAFIVDFFPSLMKLPEWLPGMGFKKLGQEWKKDTVAMTDAPVEWTKKQIESGKAVPSFISTALEDNPSMSEDEFYDLKWAAGSLYGGGADTTVSAEYAFYLAMVLFPEVQKKAQAEIDAVIGPDRLPTFADRSRLPYVDAVVTEVLRWNAVGPLGVPHTATEDNYVAGYLVPKGALIITNLWAMLHDPELYPDPFKFDPERHIATPTRPAQQDVRKIVFGWGRRVCPGLHLADASLFACVATSLAVFDISKARDENTGELITPVHENTTGTISYPKPFKCKIAPRSEKALSLISEDL